MLKHLLFTHWQLKHVLLSHMGSVVWKTSFFYFFLLVLLRVAGKREIGNLSAIDLVAFIMVSEAAIITVADDQIPFLVGVAPVVVIGVLELIMSYLSLKNHRVRNAVEGGPSVLVAHGKVDERQLRKLRYNVGNLLAELRSKNMAKVEDVEFAVLESTGKMSVIPRAGARPLTADDLRTLQVTGQDPASTLGTPVLPVPVVCDGWVDSHALDAVGKDRAWLLEELAKQGHQDLRDVLLATVEDNAQLKVTARLKGHFPDQDQQDGGHAQ